ncbi:N-acyl homoserine lactonase [Leucoagaricus sp. SymC.cos]|nr:N-acyl homoserine lactonase [Leucoagaricus sp. SymC.cos]
MSLPPPAENQAYCTVSALESGHLYVTNNLFINNPESDALERFPSLSFLLQHSSSNKRLLFDLGIRKDWRNAPPKLLASIPPTFKVEVEQDVVESLAKGGLGPDDIDIVCLSHVHFDHCGHSPLFSKSQFVVGGETKKVIEAGLFPANAESVYPAEVVPTDGRTRYLGDDVHWVPLGPFPRAYDLYGDGSLYIIDAPGHLWGHVNILVRTSADGGWIYLAGDTAHHWNLIHGTSGIACNHAGHAISHQDKEVAGQTIKRVGEVSKLPRVRVLLAHDKPWYEKNEGGDAFFPGSILSL